MTTKPSHLFLPGQRYKDFITSKVVEIPELQCLLRELVHEPTGALILHIGNDDPENLFCLSFETLPSSSNGVAHILEHTVLCGSDKYPVKDPFFAMNRRSLNTFMNALTGSDFTCYPAASQVPKDFYNLLEVYLDAVFHPTLKELSFLQEGWRLEFATPDDPSTPLEYKGIVYNEMKGGLSSGSARLTEAINAALFPDVTYGVNSGGDPKDIPQLTYEELKSFHNLYYHPSRCLFFFYGNMHLEGHLDFLAEHTLNHTKKVPSLPQIPDQPRFKSRKYHELYYPIAPDEDPSEKALIAFAWLSCSILDQETALALTILQTILLDTDASLLKIALLKSGWCKQVNYFIETEINEIPLGLTMRGCDPDRAGDIENLINATLENICHEGIPLQMVENAIHQLEFARSEITGDYAPFGLSLFMRSGLLKQHEVDPEQGLVIHSLFEGIRKKTVEDPNYFSTLIQKYLLDNPHSVRIVMKPDQDLQRREEEEEKKNLETIKSALTKSQKQELINKAQELALFQKQQEEEKNVDLLPKVSIKEVPPEPRTYPLIREKIGNVEVFHHNTFTNDIIYADLVYDLPNLREEDLPYLRLLTVILGQVGCNGRNYIENLEYIQGHTGGIGAGIGFNLRVEDYHRFIPTFQLRGKALHRKSSKLFPLLLDTISSSQFNDMERFREIVFKHFTALESRLNQGALKYAINLSASALNGASKVANDLYGLPYFWKLREIVQDFDNEGPKVLAKIQELHYRITGLDNAHLILSGDAAMYDDLKRHGFYGMKEMVGKPFEPWQGGFKIEKVHPQGRVIASSVAFIGKVFPTVSFIHPACPALYIAGHLFDNLALHPLIREQGGAYGGGAVNNGMSGHFYFYSYRDPNILKTLQAFEKAIEEVAEGNFDDTDLEEAKLEMIQSLDSPVAPGSRAELAYGWLREGKTDELRQQFRKNLLDLRSQDVIQAVNTIIKPNYECGSTVVFAGKHLLEEENVKLQAEGYTPLQIEGI